MVLAVEAAYCGCSTSLPLVDVPLASVLLPPLWEFVLLLTVVMSNAVPVVLYHRLAPLPLSCPALTLAELWLSVSLLDHGLGSVNLVLLLFPIGFPVLDLLLL